MKAIIFILLVSIFSANTASSQNIQSSIGITGVIEVFLDTKFDPNDGGTINVGYMDQNTGNSNDLFLVKLDANHQMVWQKTISNPGSDMFYRVIVCTNGDYVAAGQFCVGGLRKGFVCRINSSTGDLIWSKRSTNVSSEQLFWDVIETSNNNIAVSGVENYVSSLTNSFVALLDANGVNIWSKQSSTPLADEIRTVTQLPNGNLFFIGFYNPGTDNYYVTLTEVNEITGSTLSQNVYNISMLSPDGFYFLNSLWSINAFIRGTSVLIQFGAFQDFGSPSHLCSFNYDQTTKNLTGNLYYHPGASTLIADNFYPISANDFLLTLSSAPANQTFVSRVTNGIVVFDRLINNNSKSIIGMDVYNSILAFNGYVMNTDQDAYNFFTDINVPSSVTPCDIPNANSLTLIPINLTPTAASVVVLSDTNPLADITLTEQAPAYIINDICGFVLPVRLLNFNAAYKLSDRSVALNWSTSSELNSKEFIIERSVNNGNSYTSIGKVNAKGNSNSVSDYKFSDSKPFNGINFYRLKEIDIDGKYTYSDIRTVDCSLTKENEYSIVPVPAHAFTELKFSGNETRNIDIRLIDISGRVIRKMNSAINNSNPVRIDVRELNKGMYFLKIFSNDHGITIKKLLVE